MSEFIMKFTPVYISERKSGIERTKKRKKLELEFFPQPPRGETGTVYTL